MELTDRVGITTSHPWQQESRFTPPAPHPAHDACGFSSRPCCLFLPTPRWDRRGSSASTQADKSEWLPVPTPSCSNQRRVCPACSRVLGLIGLLTGLPP